MDVDDVSCKTPPAFGKEQSTRSDPRELGALDEVLDG
jgi:hypothetical protein